MIERKSGAILNVASTAAFQPGPGMAVYFATKAFVLSFSEALHEEVKGHGVTVTALCPGPTATEFGDGRRMEQPPPGRPIVGQLPRRRPRRPDALDRRQAVAIPGLYQQVHRAGPPPAAARTASPDRRIDQGLNNFARTCEFALAKEMLRCNKVCVPRDILS